MNTQTPSFSNTRNYSLDLLRIISMWMIVFWHVLGHGGVMEQTNSAFYYGLLLLWNACSIPVNLYVLISGYFLVTQKFRPSKLLRLYIEVVFYCLIWYGYALFSGREAFSVSNFVFSVFFPFTNGQYWFLSAYFVMYLLSPVLNFFIKAMSKRQHLLVCIGLFLLFSVWVEIYPHLNLNIFNLGNGYSFHWFLVLYFFASYLRLHADSKKWKHPLLFALVFWAAMSFLTIIQQIFGSSSAILSLWQGHFNRYNSVLTVLLSLSIFSAFLKLEVRGKFAQKLIVLTAPLTLGVYLIHENTYGRMLIWHELLHTERIPSSILVFPQVIVLATLVLLGCMAIDFLRKCFFSLWEKRTFFKKGMVKFDTLVYRLLQNIRGFLEAKI